MTSTPAAAGEPPRRPRVLWLIKGMWLGWAERLLLDVAANRDRDAFDYEAAFVLSSQAALAEELEETGVPVHPLGARRSADLRWVGALRGLLRRGRFDILHAHLPYAAAFGRLVARSVPASSRPLLVYTEHSLWHKAAVLTKALNRATAGLDAAMFTVSDASYEALPASLRRRAHVLVHGVDQARSRALVERRPARRRSLRQLVGAGEGELVALTVANMRSEKGYDVLVDAADACRAMQSPVRFVWVGTGPLEEELRQACLAKGLEETVTFLGRRSDSLELMAGADMLVLPSHQEGLPVALMEAMSVGLPVVATAVGGVPDALGATAGIVVPPGRPELLAEAVAALAGDDVLRARLAEGARTAGARFDVAASCRAIEDVYRSLLSGRHR